MNKDEKALKAATEIMSLFSQDIPTAQMKAKIQCVIIGLFEYQVSVDWSKAPDEAQWYQPATGLCIPAWFYKDSVFGLYYACFENSQTWFKEAYQEDCKEWQWVERPKAANK